MVGTYSGTQLLIYGPECNIYGRIVSKHLPYLKLLSTNSPSDASEIIHEVEIILSWQIPDELLTRAKNLRWFASTASGNEHLVNNPCIPETVTFIKSTVYGEAMTEYIFTYILYFAQDLRKHLEKQKRRDWDRKRPVRLSGKTMGIIGLGSIGKEIAKRGKQFGMNILGIKLTPEPLENVDRVFDPGNLSQVIPEVDYLIVVVPLTSRTYHMLGERELSLMNDGTIFVNIGRGKTVDERALIEILKRGRIKAVLDVFETEPLPAESELWDLQNVIITPHISGNSPGEEICEEFIVNYGNWARGESLQGLVDRKKGY